MSLKPASYGKKNGVWYASPANQGWGGGGNRRKSSVIDADNLPSSSLKPSAGRVIRIINNNDHSVQVSYFNGVLSPFQGYLYFFMVLHGFLTKKRRTNKVLENYVLK